MTAAPSHVPAPARPPFVIRVSLGSLFFLARHACFILKVLKPVAVPMTLLGCAKVRNDLRANAAQIAGRQLSASEQRTFSHGVVGNFFDFVCDLGKSGSDSGDAILSRIDAIDGEPAYLEARKQKRGAVLVTAHMGAFEVGLAALRRVEPGVHVVFKRDVFDGFEQVRSRVRQRLGVIEEPIDDGFHTLVRLRDALLADRVVVMQGDRAMPGQRSVAVPFLSGQLRMPVGPVKLARLTGSPIVPVFVVRSEGSRFRIHLGTPIEVDPEPNADEPIDPAILSLAKMLESFVSRYPTQWLILERAFVEDVSRVS